MVATGHFHLLLLALQLCQLLLSASNAFTLQQFPSWTARAPAFHKFQLESSFSRNAPTCQVLGGALQRVYPENHKCIGVPVFVGLNDDVDADTDDINQDVKPTRLGLEALVPGAFILRDAVLRSDCEDVIQFCENEVQPDNRGEEMAKIFVSDKTAARLSRTVSRHVDLDVLVDLSYPLSKESGDTNDLRYSIVGVNNLWSVLRFDQSDGSGGLVPQVHSSVCPSRISNDGTKIEWDATPPGRNICSKFTILIFLNEDFVGGQDQFLVPEFEQENTGEILASIKPRAGNILVFPQVSQDDAAIQHAQRCWPLHTSSPVSGGDRSKFVIRADLMVETSPALSFEESENPLFQFDTLVRDAFLPRSPAIDKALASQLAGLYNPHMGVENVGPLLYSLIRFTKSSKIVEIGAGYTSLWILQALKDNDEEMKRISTLQDSGKCRLMDYPWTAEENVTGYMTKKSSLLCIDNCLHQRETATGAAAVAANLGLANYFEFLQGDAYDMQFDSESIDVLWCDFGVGSRMREFARGAWNSIRPGGFLVCHSTLTNKGNKGLVRRCSCSTA